MTDLLKLGKKVFTMSVVAVTIVWSVGIAALVPTVAMAVDTCPTLQAGDLFKIPGNTSVYLLNADMQRLYFFNAEVYKTWFKDYSGVQTIPATCTDAYPAGGAVSYRAGALMVKTVLSPSVYAVLPTGQLQKIADEASATALYGTNWTKLVRDLPDVYFATYKVVAGSVSDTPVNGMLIKKASSSDVYFVKDGKLSKVEGTLTVGAGDVRTVSDTVFAKLEVATGSVTAASIVADASQGVTSGTGTTTPPVAAGNVAVSLSANTPAGGNVVKDSDVEFAKFIFKAGSTAVKVNSVKIGRAGLGATGDFASISLYDGSIKLGSTKTSWNSDNTMTYNISGGWSIPAGTTKELTVVGNLDTQSTYNSLGLVAVTGENLTVTGLPVYGNQMSAVSVIVGIVTITDAGTNATKKIGTTGVTLAQFKLAVDATENAKVESITLKNKAAAPNAADTDVANLYLYKGSTLIAGPVSMVSDKVTFTFAEPYAIDKSKNETFKVVGDIMGGDGNKVEFNLDVVGDLKVRGLTYNTLLTVNPTSAGFLTTAMVVTIDGAQLNIAYTGTNLDIVADTDDVVFGKLTLSAGSTDVKITSMIMNVVETDGDTSTTNNWDVDNFELVDLVGGGAYSGVMTAGDLTDATTADADTEIWTFSDEIYLTAGETRTFEFRGDLPTGIGNGDSYKATMTINTTNLVAETVPAGDSVDNFSIGSFTGKIVTVKKPTLTVTGVTMNNGTAVVNDQDVILYKGALEASADDITVSYADFNNTAGAAFTVANWSELGFYTVLADGTYVPQQMLSTSGMTSGTVAFDSLNILVKNGSANKVTFVVKGKVAATVDTDTVANLGLDYFTAKDSENIDVTFSPTTAGATSDTVITTGKRQVTLSETGKLFIQMVNNVAGYNKDRVVLAGSSFWAGKLKFRADDESIEIKDLKLTNATADDEDNIDEVCLYKAEVVSTENLIACAPMDADDVVFYDGIDKEVAQGTEYWYIYVKTKPMSNAANGTADSRDVITMSIATSTSGYLAAEGVKSGTPFAVGAHDAGTQAAGYWYFDGTNMNNVYNEVADFAGTASTKSFYVAGTRISGVEWVSSYGGETRSTSLEGTGPYTAGIVAITVEGNSNTDANGNPLKLAINRFLFDMTKFASTTVSGATIKRIGGVTAATALTVTGSTTEAGLSDTVDDWTLANVTTTLGNDSLIEAGTTAYFVVKPTISALVGTTNLTNWVQVGLDDLKGGVNDTNNNIDWFDGYDTTYADASDFDYLLLDTESIVGTKISAAKNN